MAAIVSDSQGLLRQRWQRRAAVISVLVGILILAIKMSAWTVSGSTAILSDALESVVHVFATLVMLWCLFYAQKPADEDHPYGHGRAEIVSVALEGGMVLLTALAVFWNAGYDLVVGPELQRGAWGLWLMLAAMLVNGALGLWLVRVGRRTESKILVADGHHVLSDVWTSVGAAAGLGLALATDWKWFDPIAALLLGTVILVTGLSLIRQALRDLLDEADPELNERVVAAINEIREPTWLDVHNLRARTSGDRVYIDFHLVVPGGWSVARAHEEMMKLEGHILDSLGKQGSVLIHLDHPELLIGKPELHYEGGTLPPPDHPISVDRATRPEADHDPSGAGHAACAPPPEDDQCEG